MRGYERLLFKVEKGEASRHRLSFESDMERRHKRLFMNTNWFKTKDKGNNSSRNRRGKGKPDQKPEGVEKETVVMFIPYTPQGALRRDLNEMEKSLTFSEKVRYVETVGPTVANRLCSQDPMGAPCQRDGCWTCQSGKAGNCMKKGLVYKITCQICQEAGSKTLYIEET